MLLALSGTLDWEIPLCTAADDAVCIGDPQEVQKRARRRFATP